MKNRLPLLLFSFFVSHFSFAQYDATKVPRKAVAAYNLGLELAQADRFPQAIDALNAAIRLDPAYVEAYLSLAGVYGQMKNNEQSIATYEKAFALDSNYTSDFRLPYAINVAGAGQFQKAYDVISALLARPKLSPNTRKAAEYRQKTFQFALDYAKKNNTADYVFKPTNLGDGVNTKESEYFPTLPIEAEELIFTRRLNGANEDFFLSKKGATTWDKAFRLTGNINTAQNEGAQNVSQDGQWLVFTGCNRARGIGGCDIYISYNTKDGWSEATNMGSKINSEFWDSQPSISPDKQQIYFASSRPGGYGGADIYVSDLLPNGKWSEARNLGPNVNTSGDEICPFVHADNETLYFSSTGWPGYGDKDLYLARRDKTGDWSTPRNLGYPINTINEEGSLFVSADGRTAYFASDRSDSRGGLDIYSFELRSDIQPARTLWVKGTVSDVKTGAGLPSAVELTNLASGRLFQKVQTDEKGAYLITLPVGKNFAFNVARKGYLFYSDNFSLTDKATDSVYKKDIALQPIEANAAVVLRNIFFDVAKFNLKETSQTELARVVQLLNDNPTVKITIEGHTDNVGTAADNAKLSQARAKAVVDYLVSKGVAAARLAAKGFGATKPVVANTTEEGRAQNRRTELKVSSK